MKYKLSILFFCILQISCSKEIIKETEPFSFKKFQIQKYILEDREFILENVFVYKFTTNLQVSVNGNICYILLVSENPEKYTRKEHDKELQEYIYPPDKFLTCYIPAFEVKIIESLLDKINEDKITKIIGIGKYPSMMEGKKSCILPDLPGWKIPYTTIGVYVKSISFDKK